MMPAQASAKKSSPLLSQSEVSSSGRGLAHLTLETKGLAPPKEQKSEGDLQRTQLSIPPQRNKVSGLETSKQNSTTKDISLGVNVVGKSHKADYMLICWLTYYILERILPTAPATPRDWMRNSLEPQRFLYQEVKQHRKLQPCICAIGMRVVSAFLF